MRFVVGLDKRIATTMIDIEPIDVVDALEMEIERWEVIANWYKNSDECVDDGGPSYDALCALYYKNTCVGCPLNDARNCCLSHTSTYHIYADAVREGDAKTARAAAEKMLQLLRIIRDDYPRRRRPRRR